MDHNGCPLAPAYCLLPEHASISQFDNYWSAPRSLWFPAYEQTGGQDVENNFFELISAGTSNNARNQSPERRGRNVSPVQTERLVGKTIPLGE